MAFARHRATVGVGEQGRSNAQLSIITAVIAKVTSPSSIYKVDKILESMTGNFITNLPKREITNGIKRSLGSWSISTYQPGATSSFALDTFSNTGKRMHIQHILEKDVITARNKIKAILK